MKKDMHIKDFINQYKNFPVLFVGTGISLRYLSNSYKWDELLSKIYSDIHGNQEIYLNLKYKHKFSGTNEYDYPSIASIIENEFNDFAERDRNGKFKIINDRFFENMRSNISTSRFKLYIADIFSEIVFRDSLIEELESLKKASLNIASIITTNYDNLLEKIFEFNPLVGNDILLSNHYGAIYKIHGCTKRPDKIIITQEDYDFFDSNYELINAQLLSLFISNPIIFAGYSIQDNNIRKLLQSIFRYVNPNSELANKIKNNFLIIEYEKGSKNEMVTDYAVSMENGVTVTIKRLKTDNYALLYSTIAELALPVSAMEIRKVQAVMERVISTNNENTKPLHIAIRKDLEEIKNGDLVIAITSEEFKEQIENVVNSETVTQYKSMNSRYFFEDYFTLIESENLNAIKVIDDILINKNEYFPAFGFSKIHPNLSKKENLKKKQSDNITAFKRTPNFKRHETRIFNNISDVINSDIPSSYQIHAIVNNVLIGKINPSDLKQFILEMEEKNTNYRRLLCVYDYIVYGDIASL